MATKKEKEVVNLGDFQLEEDPIQNKRKIREFLEAIEKGEKTEKITRILKKKKKVQPASADSAAAPWLRPDGINTKQIKFVGKMLNTEIKSVPQPMLNKVDINNIINKVGSDKITKAKVGDKVCTNASELATALATIDKNTPVTIETATKKYTLTLTPPEEKRMDLVKQTTLSEQNKFRVDKTNVQVTEENVYNSFEGMIDPVLEQKGDFAEGEISTRPQKFINDFYGPEEGTIADEKEAKKAGQDINSNKDLHAKRMESFYENFNKTIGEVKVGSEYTTKTGAKFSVVDKADDGSSITVVYQKAGKEMQVKINLPDQKKFTQIKYDEGGLDKNYIELMKKENPKFAALIEKSPTYFTDLNQPINGDSTTTEKTRVDMAVALLKKSGLAEKDVKEFITLDDKVRKYQRTGKLEMDGDVKLSTRSYRLDEGPIDPTITSGTSTVKYGDGHPHSIWEPTEHQEVATANAGLNAKIKAAGYSLVLGRYNLLVAGVGNKAETKDVILLEKNDRYYLMTMDNKTGMLSYEGLDKDGQPFSVEIPGNSIRAGNVSGGYGHYGMRIGDPTGYLKNQEPGQVTGARADDEFMLNRTYNFKRMCENTDLLKLENQKRIKHPEDEKIDKTSVFK